jgi:hypothetical protein
MPTLSFVARLRTLLAEEPLSFPSDKTNSAPNIATSGARRPVAGMSRQPKQRSTQSKPGTINPFDVPGWSPPRPLCPWREPRHRDYYVSIESLDYAFNDFTYRMNDLATLLSYGQMVLVTGDRECGKSALVNRCTDWVLQELRIKGMSGDVVDLTSRLAGRERGTIDDRMSFVCDLLVNELRHRGILRRDALEEILTDCDKSDRSSLTCSVLYLMKEC